MAQTLVSLLVHIIFSTKKRANFITPEIESELYAYIGGTLRNFESPSLAINGTSNHIHLLIALSKNLALSPLIREIKKSSSKWIKSKGPAFHRFGWQDGYGAFSIGQSAVADLIRYIAKQKEKHKRKSFETEFVEFLRKYHVNYDERYIWD